MMRAGLQACLQKPHIIHAFKMFRGKLHAFRQQTCLFSRKIEVAVEQKCEWSLSKLQCELRWSVEQKWAKYDVMRMGWQSWAINTGSGDLLRMERLEDKESICFSEILRERWPFRSPQDTIWWGIMMSVNPRRVKFYFQLPTIWEALCKQRPFQLWIPKLYWSLIIICIHKAIHDRLLQALCGNVQHNKHVSFKHSSILPRQFVWSESSALWEPYQYHLQHL